MYPDICQLLQSALNPPKQDWDKCGSCGGTGRVVWADRSLPCSWCSEADDE